MYTIPFTVYYIGYSMYTGIYNIIDNCFRIYSESLWLIAHVTEDIMNI